uniref:Uncharacterized protein n=1 Tax=Candidatus Kentrum sp. FW TaxID=2126338 RepID=A0A450U043_9GAMM|nr:MAG: hypothetical protein BECKFW1821C_GA0114237_10852 [Candidatus Kentron sp. FW]
MRRRIEGKGITYFRLDRNGNVLARELRAKTGSGILGFCHSEFGSGFAGLGAEFQTSPRLVVDLIFFAFPYSNHRHEYHILINPVDQSVADIAQLDLKTVRHATECGGRYARVFQPFGQFLPQRCFDLFISRSASQMDRVLGVVY